MILEHASYIHPLSLLKTPTVIHLENDMIDFRSLFDLDIKDFSIKKKQKTNEK